MTHDTHTTIPVDNWIPAMETLCPAEVFVCSYSSGAWFGTLSGRNHTEVILAKATLVKGWPSALPAGGPRLTMSPSEKAFREQNYLVSLATYGVRKTKSERVEVLPAVVLTEVFRVFSCTKAAAISIRAFLSGE